jgi:hypothetical protein
VHDSEGTRLHLLTTHINSLRLTRVNMIRTCKFCFSPYCLSYLAQLSSLASKSSPRTNPLRAKQTPIANNAVVHFLYDASAYERCVKSKSISFWHFRRCVLFWFGNLWDLYLRGLSVEKFATRSFANRGGYVYVGHRGHAWGRAHA